MRLSVFGIVAVLASCAQLEGLDRFESVDGVSDAVTTPDGSTGSSSGNPPPAVTTGDVQPGPPHEAGAPDDGSSPSDAGPDSGTPPPPPPPPPPTDIAPTGTATTSTGFVPTPTPAPALNDANDGSDFTLGPDTCLAKSPGGQICGPSSGLAPWIQVSFGAPQTVAHVTILGSRNPALAAAHILTGQLQLLDAAGSALLARDLSMGDPYGDADVVLGAPLANVVYVRLLIVSAQQATPSFAELKVYSQ